MISDCCLESVVVLAEFCQNFEEENTNLKAALDVANKEVSRLKNDKIALSDKASKLMGKKNDLEAYLGGLAQKLFLMLEGNLL